MSKKRLTFLKGLTKRLTSKLYRSHPKYMGKVTNISSIYTSHTEYTVKEKKEVKGKTGCHQEYVCMLSRVVLFATPWTIACQAPLPMEFSRSEYWSGLLFPTPGDILTQGSNPYLLCLLHWQAKSLPLHHLRKPIQNAS